MLLFLRLLPSDAQLDDGRIASGSADQTLKIWG